MNRLPLRHSRLQMVCLSYVCRRCLLETSSLAKCCTTDTIRSDLKAKKVRAIHKWIRRDSHNYHLITLISIYVCIIIHTHTHRNLETTSNFPPNFSCLVSSSRNGQFQDRYYGHLPWHDPEVSDGKSKIAVVLKWCVKRKHLFCSAALSQDKPFKSCQSSCFPKRFKCSEDRKWHKPAIWCLHGSNLTGNPTSKRDIKWFWSFNGLFKHILHIYLWTIFKAHKFCLYVAQ